MSAEQKDQHPEDQPTCRLPKKRLRAAIECERLLLATCARDRLLGVLPAVQLDALMAAHCSKHRSRLFPPEVTLGLFMEQVISSDPTCQEAVGRYLSQRAALGLGACSLGTGGFCRARKRLPAPFVEACARAVADIAAAALPAAARWRGREIKLIDGTQISMPDMPELQAVYPQNKQQQPGLGFPQVRVVGVVSLSSGCALNWTLSPCEGKGSGEPTQLWNLLGGFSTGDLVIADRIYCTYFLLAAMQQRGIDFVIRENANRKNDSVHKVNLGRDDRILVWTRPAKPAWMDDATYAQIPEAMRVREVKDGARMIVTSLCDPAAVPATEIAWLYRQRWAIELDFHSIKEALQMSVLRCKSKDMVRKEIAAHLLGYNLIRVVMGEAARPEGLCLRTLSFAAARRAASLYQTNLRWIATPRHRAQARFLMLQQTAHFRIPDRPGRVEPRAVKRRPKPRTLLTEPRHLARARILKQQQAMRA